MYPKCQISLKAQKRPNLAYPVDLCTIGDHLRKVRLDRGLSQPEVAKLLGVQANTITNWELKHNEPYIHQWPMILEFLGYYPDQDDGTLAFRVRKFRREQGLRQKVLAERIGVDEKTLWRIEERQGKRLPFQKTIKKILTYMTSFNS